VKKLILLSLAVVLAGCGKKVEPSVPELMAALKDRDPKVRSYAARHLGGFGTKAEPAIPALIEALRDEDKDVRKGAAHGLRRIGRTARAAIPALKESLNDSDRAVRQEAAYALIQLQAANPKPAQPAQARRAPHKSRQRYSEVGSGKYPK
jgi:HEAT repeat protein